MFDFFKSKSKPKDCMENKITTENSLKERFLRYKEVVKNKGEIYDKNLIVNYLISVIVEKLNFLEATQALEFKHTVQNNSLLDDIYQKLESNFFQNRQTIVVDIIHEDDKNCYLENGYELVYNNPIEIGINELPILLNPWNGERVVDNLVKINENNNFDGIKHSSNIQNYYLYPMNIVICFGGNHSQFSAKMKNKGVTIIRELHNYSNIYSLVEFDGENYLNRKDKSVIELNYNKEILFYSGVIFEMGRYLLENKFHSIKLAAEKFK